MSDQTSQLRLYSLGIVVEDKPVGSDFVMVSPIEVLNIQPGGSIKESSTKFEGTLKNTSGKNFATEMSSTNYIKAKWLPLGNSNRITSPDVVKNETIVLFKFGDVDEYYWTTIFREVELRRQETVLYGFSNLKSGISAFDKSTSYWLEVDTKKKSVKFHTAMNDGEHTEYDIQIDTKQGTFLLTDKKGNKFFLESQKEKFTVYANKQIDVQAGQVINVKAPTINLEGNVNIKGNVSTVGNTNTQGNVTMTGNQQVNGNINASGSIIDGGGNTNNHSH